jgi:hypothetical protein
MPIETLRIWRLLIYRWKSLENTFPVVYYMPKISKFAAANQKQQICSCLTTADQGGQMNHNGKMIAVLCCNVSTSDHTHIVCQ